MVRINLIKPKFLTDQHLVAEYLEILMLIGSIKENFDVSKIPDNYVLGKGHINFFKDKTIYLKNRHEILKKEMKKRGFNPKKEFNLDKIPKTFHNNWVPKKEDYEIIKERLLWKIRLKPEWYRYYGERKGLKFYEEMIKYAK
jgi:deoxyribonuclease (pyrimidine dimer)